MRRGSVYLLVLTVGTVLSVIGLSMLSISRAGARSLDQTGNLIAAKMLAFSGAEQALATLAADTNWRTDYAGQTVSKTMENGTFSWCLVDESGNALTASSTGSFAIVSTGTSGTASYATNLHVTVTSGSTTAGVSTSMGVTLTGSSVINSFDSSTGVYGSNAVVQTNATSWAAVSLDWSTKIYGNVQIGPGGRASTVVYNPSGSSVSGTITAQSQSAAMPTVSAPTNLGASFGAITYSNWQTTVLTQNVHGDTINLNGSGRLSISGNVTILAEGDFDVTDAAVLSIQSGSSLTVYCKGTINFNNSASVSLSGQNLSRVKFYSIGGGVNITGNSQVRGVVIAPNGQVQITGSSQLSGIVVAKSLSVIGGSYFHEDKRITTGTDPVSTGGGTSSATTPDAWKRIVY